MDKKLLSANLVMNVIYRITYPNGKIYIGQNRTNSINYFGSASDALIASDFTAVERQSFSVKRDILWESETASRTEITKKEVELILEYRSNHPSVGYNQWPLVKKNNKDESPINFGKKLENTWK